MSIPSAEDRVFILKIKLKDGMADLGVQPWKSWHVSVSLAKVGTQAGGSACCMSWYCNFQ